MTAKVPLVIPPPDPRGIDRLGGRASRQDPFAPDPALIETHEVRQKPIGRHIRDFMIALVVLAIGVGGLVFGTMNPLIGKIMVFAILGLVMVFVVGVFLWEVTA